MTKSMKTMLAIYYPGYPVPKNVYVQHLKFIDDDKETNYRLTLSCSLIKVSLACWEDIAYIFPVWIYLYNHTPTCDRHLFV